MVDEVWKDIKGFEGYYQISNYGRVKSLSRPVYLVGSGIFHRFKKETIKKPKIDKDGYECVTLSVNGYDKTFAIHRLVALHFLTVPDDYLEKEINHKDYNRRNNYYENLEWVTHKDNVQYSSEQGRYCCEGVKNSRSRKIVIEKSNEDENFYMKFDSITECAKWMIDNNICKATSILGALNCITKSIKLNRPYFGYTIKYL